MRFKIKETGKYEWFNGQILHFDPEYGAFFPSDGQTVHINASQERDDIVFFSLLILSALKFHSSIGDVHHY